MPQLCDSGNIRRPADGRTRGEVDAFIRIFGIETEYESA